MKIKNTNFKNFINNIIFPISIIMLAVIVAWSIAFILTSSRAYYRFEFAKNNTVNSLHWVYENEEGIRVYKEYDSDDLEIIMNKIVDYMTNKTDYLQIVDEEGMNVFSNQAIYHMQDVKRLYNIWTIIIILLIPLLICAIIYINKNIKDIAKTIKKQVIITFSIIGFILLIVVIGLIIDSTSTFIIFHHIIFPKIEDFNDAMFYPKSNYQEAYYINNLLLVKVLSLNVFIDAGWIIIVALILICALYIFLIMKKALKIQKNNSNLDIA